MIARPQGKRSAGHDAVAWSTLVTWFLLRGLGSQSCAARVCLWVQRGTKVIKNQGQRALSRL